MAKRQMGTSDEGGMMKRNVKFVITGSRIVEPIDGVRLGEVALAGIVSGDAQGLETGTFPAECTLSWEEPEQIHECPPMTRDMLVRYIGCGWVAENPECRVIWSIDFCPWCGKNLT